VNTKTLPLALLLAMLLVPLRAEAEESESYELKPDLVVTPSRRVESLSDSLAAISVLTREDIQRSAAEDLYELLATLPGVDVVRSGGPGAQVSVFLRGSNSNHVLVLIDGVRASSSNTGSYVWEQLPINQVERIEVVRGPKSSLYGSDSIGGVIHVITRGATESYARVTAGSYGTAELEGGSGFQGESTRISINVGYRDVDGFSVQNENGFSYHPDEDGFTSANLGIKGETRGGDDRWTYSLLVLDNESEFDQGTSETRQSIASLGFHSSFSPNWDYQLQAGYAGEELESDFGFFLTGFDSERLQLTFQNQLITGQAGVLGFGLDWYEESGESLDSWDETRRNTGIFANWDFYLDQLHAQVGGRMDDNSQFGSQFTGQAALGYEIGTAWQLMASYGTAFRGPNLSEQFSPGWGGLFAGNPDLDPESSVSGEIGLRWQHAQAGSVSLALYHTEVDDLIAFNGPAFQAVNIDEARLKGMELAYRLSNGPWRLDANLTLQDTEDRATGQSLLRRPDEKASITVDRVFDGGSWIGLEWVYTGDRDDFGGIPLDSYRLLNLRGGWKILPAWQFEVRGDNLADEDYQPAWGFNAPGRSWFISLAWTP
jgi:vitamin B12 transporter